jgi:hypothetical protein
MLTLHKTMAQHAQGMKLVSNSFQVDFSHQVFSSSFRRFKRILQNLGKAVSLLGRLTEGRHLEPILLHTFDVQLQRQRCSSLIALFSQ